MAATASTLDIIVRAIDEASAELQNIANAAEGLGKKFEQASKSSTILLGGITALAGAVAYTSLKAFSEAEVSIAKVDATLRAMEKTSRTVVTGTKQVSVAVKHTADEMAAGSLAIQSA